MKRVLYGFMAICAILVIVSCGGSKGSKEYTDVEKMLMANDWKFQAQSFLDDLSDNLEETADLTANLKLDGDVGKIVNFFVETLIFLGEDDKRTGFNVFKRVIGEGWLSSETLGWWQVSEDENYVTMIDWDEINSKEQAPKTYLLQELTDEKLIMLKENEALANTYLAKGK